VPLLSSLEEIREFDRVPRLRLFGSAVLFTKGHTLVYSRRALAARKNTAERQPLSRGTRAKYCRELLETLEFAQQCLQGVDTESRCP
jgi:hypothetical protein